MPRRLSGIGRSDLAVSSQSVTPSDSSPLRERTTVPSAPDVVAEVDVAAQPVHARRVRRASRLSSSWASPVQSRSDDEEHAAEVADGHHPAGHAGRAAERRRRRRRAAALVRAERRRVRVGARRRSAARASPSAAGPARAAAGPRSAGRAGGGAGPGERRPGRDGASGPGPRSSGGRRNAGRSMKPSATPSAVPTRAMSRVSAKQRKRGCHSGRYFTLERYSDSNCHQREATSSSRRHSRRTGPGADPGALLEGGAEHGEVQRDAPDAELRAGRHQTALTISSVTPLSAVGAAPHDVEGEAVGPPRHERQQTRPRRRPGRRRVRVRAGSSASTIRQSASAGSPSRPSAIEKPRSLSVSRQASARSISAVSSAAGMSRWRRIRVRVAESLEPLHRLADRAHLAVGEVEVARVQHGLVADPDDPQAEVAGVRGRAGLARPDHGGRPAVGVDQALPGADRRLPAVGRPDRVAAGQADAEVDPVGHRRPAVRRRRRPTCRAGWRSRPASPRPTAPPARGRSGSSAGDISAASRCERVSIDDGREQGQAEQQTDDGADPAGRARTPAAATRSLSVLKTVPGRAAAAIQASRPRGPTSSFGNTVTSVIADADGDDQPDHQGEQRLADAARRAPGGELGPVVHQAGGQRAERGQVEGEPGVARAPR